MAMAAAEGSGVALGTAGTSLGLASTRTSQAAKTTLHSGGQRHVAGLSTGAVTVTLNAAASR